MKIFFAVTVFGITHLFSPGLSAQPSKFKIAAEEKAAYVDSTPKSKNLFIDVHHLGAGKVTAKQVAAAHQKDLAVQAKYGVNILKYWVDEKNGDVYCLASAPDSQSLRATHAEAHGLLPSDIHKVTSGTEASPINQKNLFLDVHELGAGKVTAKDVEGAHQKDLATQKKYGVNLINYWVDEKRGTVMCLAQAPDSSALINTHKEAHGLVPLKVIAVKQGQ